MSELPNARYCAAVGDDLSLDDAEGLLRRRETADGRLDEALQRDRTWARTTSLTRWEHGDISFDYVEISAEKADELVERFRMKWAAGGDALS